MKADLGQSLPPNWDSHTLLLMLYIIDTPFSPSNFIISAEIPSLPGALLNLRCVMALSPSLFFIWFLFVDYVGYLLLLIASAFSFYGSLYNIVI